MAASLDLVFFDAFAGFHFAVFMAVFLTVDCGTFDQLPTGLINASIFSKEDHK